MSVKYIPPSKNVGESVHDINDNFETLDKQNTAIAQSVAGKADTADVQDLATQLNSKANASDLDSKADKASLASKVDNDQTGATELIDALGESNATPGTEDSFIVKSLNQYTRRPFTALLNWIKSNLAKIATSGSYNDLSDKPTIPKAVTVDAELSSTSTNPPQNKTVKAKFDAVDSQISSLGIDNNNQWTKINSKADADHNHDSAYAAKNHTHNYAGSSSAGGSATSAVALTSKNVGSNVVPTYFDANGKPAVCKYTLGDASTKIIKTATAVSSAAWVNLATGQKYIPDMAFLSYWDGSYHSSGSSNLTYCNKGKFGTAATKGVDTDVTSNSANLVTSGGVYSKLYQYRPMAYLPGTSGKVGYVCFAELKVTANYNNMPIEFKISSRGRFICNVTVRFANKGNTDPDIETLSFCGEDYKIYAYKSATSTWELYALKSESYDSIYVLSTYRPGAFSGTITYPGTFVATKHTGTTTNPVIDSTWGYKVSTAINATTWNGLTDDTMTANTTDTRLMVLNGNKVQHRQIDTLPFLSSSDLAQPVLYTSTTTTTSATITGLFANYSLVWFQVVGSKTTHTHILPLKYLKSKGSLTFKDSGTPINILYVSDTQIRWFEYQGQGAETYTSVTIVKII